VWSSTETLTTQIIRQYPDHLEAPYYTRAKFYNEHGEYVYALQDINTALTIAQNHNQTKKYPAIYIAKAHVLYNLGNMEEALYHAELAITTSQDAPPAVYSEFRNNLQSLIAVEKNRR
jgi:tetratricopeptide (TPR) repeat protein